MGRRRTLSDLPRHLHQKGKAFYYVTYDNRTKKTKWLALGSDKVKALAEWARLEGEAFTSPTGTFGYCLERYIDEILPTKTKKTQANYRRSAESLHKVFGKTPTQSITPQHIYKYLDMHPKPYVANRDIKFMSVVFGYAMRWGECAINPCRGVKRHSEPPRDRYITADERAALLAAASPSMRLIIEMAYITAMRKGDLLNIRLSDVKDEGLYVRQGKTGKRQLFEWTPTLRRIVADARKLPRRVQTLYLFTSRKGTPYTSDGFDSNWQRIMKRAGVTGAHFHDLRGSSITDAKSLSGIDNAQALAGHKNSTMTEQYIRQRGVQRVRPIK